MKYVRPFDASQVQPGAAGPWLIAPEESLGLSMRVRRGGQGFESRSENERFLVVLEGRLTSKGPSGDLTAGSREVVFLPAGATAILSADADTRWLEVESAPRGEGSPQPLLATIDESKFEGTGFAHQQLFGRSNGTTSLRINLMHVQPGAGSPDFHIHAFSQIYVIQEGELTVDVGRTRYKAAAPCVAVLPPGVVHRNYNASGAMEKHISFLAPEPLAGEIFDYAVDIHEEEAEIMTAIPADAA